MQSKHKILDVAKWRHVCNNNNDSVEKKKTKQFRFLEQTLDAKVRNYKIRKGKSKGCVQGQTKI